MSSIPTSRSNNLVSATVLHKVVDEKLSCSNWQQCAMGHLWHYFISHDTYEKVFSHHACHRTQMICLTHSIQMML